MIKSAISLSGGCHRRGANECLESGKLLTRDDTTIPNNRDCIEVATVEDDQITRGQSERQIQPEMCRVNNSLNFINEIKI